MIFLLVFIVLSVVRLYYVFRYFIKVKSVIAPQTSRHKSISVVVCVKDNSKGIDSLLKILKSQTYSDFDIIVVDDYSSDEIEKVKTKYPDVTWLTPTEDVIGKKRALSEGISTAKTEYILVTDSDCEPTQDWIQSMVDNLHDNDVVLGASPMKRSRGLVNMLARNETIWVALQYLGYAAQQDPYMGVGRNMLFKKELFDKVSGFDSHMEVISGDDDLFIQSIIGKGKIGVSLDPATIVMTESKYTWSGLISQKTRHVSTSLQYGFKHKIQLSIFALVHGMWVLYLGLLILTGTHLFVTTVVAVGYWLMMLIGTVRGYNFMKGKDLWIKLPLLDVLMAFYYLVIGWFTFINRLGKKSKWN